MQAIWWKYFRLEICKTLWQSLSTSIYAHFQSYWQIVSTGRWPESELNQSYASFPKYGGRSVFNPSEQPRLEPNRKLFSFDFSKNKWRLLDQEHNAWNLLKEFCERVKIIIVSYPTLKINRIIDSMDKRINMIIERKGQRIKYWWKFHL